MFTRERPQVETEPATPYPGERWEYKALNLNYKMSITFEGEFNKLGRQGWEFVGWVGRDKVHRAIFKRPLV